MNNVKSNIRQQSTLNAIGEKSPFKKRIWGKVLDHILTPFIRYLYRSRLKGLIGGTMVVLTHTGRKTGKIRKTVLYAQHYNPMSKELKLIAAFGITDWFLNISKEPTLLVEVGGVRYVPEQRILTVNEIAEVERRFRQKHPLVARVQAWLMDWPWHCSDEEFLAFARSLRGVVFWPKGSDLVEE